MDARFTEYWPEFLEHVGWRQHPRVLTLRNATSGGGVLKDTPGLGSLKGKHRSLPEEKDPGILPPLPPQGGGTEKSLHTPVLGEADNLCSAPGQYHKGPEYGAAELYPGGTSDLDLASVHPGHVCSSPQSDEQCAETPSLPHSRSACEE